MPKKWPWEAIEEEVRKCDLMCSNCHTKHHSVWVLSPEGDWIVELDRHA